MSGSSRISQIDLAPAQRASQCGRQRGDIDLSPAASAFGAQTRSDAAMILAGDGFVQMQRATQKASSPKVSNRNVLRPR